MIAVVLILSVIVESMMVGSLIMYVRQLRSTMGQFGNDLESMRCYLLESGMVDDGRADGTDGTDGSD